MRPGRLEQRVPAGRDLADPAADRKHEIGLAEPVGQAVVHCDSEHSRVAARAVVDEVLAAEGARDR
jgi:hypothetical protein